MDTARAIQAAVVRVDMVIVAAWHILKFALPVAMVTVAVAAGLNRLRRGR